MTVLYHVAVLGVMGYNPAKVKLLKIASVVVISLLVIGGAAYGGFAYGHKTGYNSAQTVANKQISALKKQDDADKAQADKYKAQMWADISTNAQPNSVSPALNCTSSTYGIDNQYTNTSCN